MGSRLRWHERRIERERQQVDHAELAAAPRPDLVREVDLPLSALTWDKPLEAGRGQGNWDSRPPNWYQLGWHSPARDTPRIAAIYRCQSLIAESVAPVRLAMERRNGKVWEEVERSAYSRLLANPNHYQNGVDFRLYAMFSLLSDGNAYAWAERDVQGMVTALHPIAPGGAQPMRVPSSGDVFYRFPRSAHDVMERPDTIPARDVWHLRGRTTSDPLCGISPLVATHYNEVLQFEMQQTSAEFFGNKARPGGILKTAANLDETKATNYRLAWERAAKEGFKGRTAILDRGLEYQDLTVSAVDAALVDQYGLTIEEIARAYGVPGWKIGLGDPSYSNAETMDQAFTAETLRFYYDLIEASLHTFFRLAADQRLNFQLDERMAKAGFTERVDGLTRGIQGGLLSVNEARAKINLPPVPHGNEIIVQQQMTSLEQAVAEPEPMPIPSFGQPPVEVPAPDEEEPAA